MALKNNKYFRLIITILCIALCFVGNFLPDIPNGLSSSALQVLLIFLGCLILWLTIGIDWPSLLCIFALGFVDELGFNTVLSKSFGNGTFIFLLFTFICTYALSKTSILKRITLAFIDNKIAKSSGLLFCLLFLLASLVIGLFTSPSVLFVVILAILNEIFAIANIQKGDKIAKALLIGLGFTISISSGMTPIAHVFPVLALKAANLDISTFTYTLFAVPIGLVAFASMFVILFILYRPNFDKLNNIDVSSIKEQLPPLGLKDLIVPLTFIFVILLWVLPDLYKNYSSFFNYLSGLTTAMPPLLGTLVLLVVRVDDKPIIKVDEAFKSVPWGSLVMCAATLVLGVALTNDAIGIQTFLQNTLSSNLSSLPYLALLVIFCFWAMVQTNISSNMVTATLVATVASSVLVGLNMDTKLITICICSIGMLASFAFATPPSMPHIAIIAGSEYCDVKDVLMFGSILGVVSVVATVLIGFPLGLLIF